jgi:glyoxylase-like metal-dependent hydrolase (beta-lactamase superfamily II)
MIDTGYNAKEMLSTIKQRNLKLTSICLTHAHADHAGGLDQILAEWPVPVYLGEGDFDLLPWKPSKDRVRVPKDRETIGVGNLNFEFLATPGHTPGGFCYRMGRQQEELCFVGDTLFAGSVGRSNPFSLYSSHLRSVREVVLQLPEETILLPGHGPATTVREEVLHNPFT